MTADQLIAAVFVDHWLAATFIAPGLTLLYAWVTDQTTWWMCSAGLSLFYYGLKPR